MSKSCVGCKYLYGLGVGYGLRQRIAYSNYTWMNTLLKCALDKNPNLLAEVEGCDWVIDPDKDNCPATNQSRCPCYCRTPEELLTDTQNGYLVLDVDADNGPADFTRDPEAVLAIGKHANRGLHGNGYEELAYHDLVQMLGKGTP